MVLVREGCCCPTFLIATGGPWLAILGGVLTDKVIVQRLTDLRWMAISSTEEDDRVYHNAKALVALRRCLENLRKYYETLNYSEPPFIPRLPHPRYFPYPTSFTVNNTSTQFRYLLSLEDDPTCVTYLAEVINQNGATGAHDHVVVKFVMSYGRNVHEFLALKGFAPTLRYYGPLRDFPGPAEKSLSVPGLKHRSNGSP
jgi:hypothetical protein